VRAAVILLRTYEELTDEEGAWDLRDTAAENTLRRSLTPPEAVDFT